MAVVAVAPMTIPPMLPADKECKDGFAKGAADAVPEPDVGDE